MSPLLVLHRGGSDRVGLQYYLSLLLVLYQVMLFSILRWNLGHKVFRGWWSMLFYDCEDSGTIDENDGRGDDTVVGHLDVRGVRCLLIKVRVTRYLYKLVIDRLSSTSFLH